MTDTEIRCTDNLDAPADIVPDHDLIERLAREYRRVILDKAATFEEQFKDGPGDVVGVREAAWVLARHVAAQRQAGEVPA